MPLAAAGLLLGDATAAGRGVASFNVITLEHVEAVIDGAERAGAPVIVQISENAVRYRGGALLPLARAVTAAAEAADVPVALHLDHVRDTELLRRAADAGCGSVMIDASHLPYAENTALTRDAVTWAHDHGLWTEAELGQIGGKPGTPPLDPHAPGARTDPTQAREFTAATGVDALAVAIGSTHAMATRSAELDHALLARLAEAVPVPLVLHGASGVPDTELSAAVRGGITKVNIGTALNAALTAETRRALGADPGLTDPRRWLAPGRDAMARVVAALIPPIHTPAALPAGHAPGRRGGPRG
uniref:class II fructose-bisphosphate aldolase n=1 Tax=Streptomyces otsuchiensis TaxID=2681388 RepID=UPI00103005C3